jgi:hydrogenase-4 component B
MTPLNICLASAATLVASALGSFMFGSQRRIALWTATFGCLLACFAGIAASVAALQADAATSLLIGWTLPMGAFHVGLDPVSAFFLLVLFLVSAITSIYAAGYTLAHGEHHGPDYQPGWTNLMNAAMALILLSRDGILFLMAWEVMSIVSFFLVTQEHDREDVRKAGFIYLAASHLGTVFIFLLFAWLYRNTGTLDFDVWMARGAAPVSFSGLAFVLALIGFGTKAGIWPLHIWLPYAHPAAPSPVSAMMSCVMIKMGIYGIVRTLSFLGLPSPWWGAILIALGVISGVLGVLLALAQNDYKRLLAYSSIENIGIITLGLGIGVLGQSQGQHAVAFFGYAGAILHVLNHALFKGLLFQAAGCILLQTGERNVNLLGGLSQRMPVTSALFLFAAIAICGIPPLNGFVSELLIYTGAFRGGALVWPGAAMLSIIGLGALALIGGLALACFVKVHGVAFLGQPRSGAGQGAREVGPLLLAPMTSLALLCAVIGLFPMAALRLVAPVVRAVTRNGVVPSPAVEMAEALTRIELVILGVAAALMLVRLVLLRRRVVTRAPTWGCGYAAPSPRMQYTAGSFAAPALATFRRLLATSELEEPNENPFPVSAAYSVQYRDLAAHRGIFPVARLLQRTARGLRVLQQGRIQLYLMYVFGSLLVVLVWLLILGR